MTRDERRAALDAIASEVRDCTRCRLHEGRTRAVPGEGDPDTEVVFVGEGPGFNEDREGRPFVGRAGGMLVRLLGSIGWQRDDVFITNVVKCRPPDNRDPQPDEIAACAPYLRRQLEVLDPAVVVTLGRYSMGTFIPGARIGQAHGTTHPVDPDTGAREALVYAMYHPAAALRSPGVERDSFQDMARIPDTLLRARAIRGEGHANPGAGLAPQGEGDTIAASETRDRGDNGLRRPATADAPARRTRPGTRTGARRRRTRAGRCLPAHALLTPSVWTTCPMADPNTPLRIIPLGGVGEIGKNMYVFEYGDDIVVVDCGLMFPDEEMFGIDLVIPDVQYLTERRANVKAFLITHAHEDHVGALPYVLPEFPGVPVYASTLARGLLGNKIKEHKLHNNPLISLEPGDELEIGPFTAIPFRIGHSIPDAMGIALRTPVGIVVHTGDFKFDHTPVDGRLSDFHILARLGEEGVICLLSDSTRAENPGYTPSERIVGEAFREIMEPLDGRVIVATFASNIARIQQVLDAAADMGRKTTVIGRSMEQNFRIATDLGYLKYEPSAIVGKDKIKDIPADKLVIATTGAQGEPMAGLARMANNDHRFVEIQPGDTVIVSASPIPGNEEYVARTIDNLFKAGANVYYHTIKRAHVSGHASQEELKLMLGLTKPRYFIPMHGEFRMLVQHGRLAIETGVSAENVFIIENGTPIEILADGSARRGQPVTAGYVFVDGLSVGEVGDVVLRDRRALANDGMFMIVVQVDKQTGRVVGLPEIITRGFVHGAEEDRIIEEAIRRLRQAVDQPGDRISEIALLKSQIKDSVSRFLYEQTKRRPMVFPVVVEV